ncbi:MAG: hypothetical protein Q8O88_02980 [bacterium]|nr:hypothetical protein [bacterium]
MPEILDKTRFSPNKDARDKWLYSRKSRIEGTTHPGYFQTVNYSTDKNWVWMVVFIELAAAGVTIYGGITKGLVFMLIALGAVALFIVFDIVGANFHHSPVKEKRKSKCSLSVVDYQIKNNLNNPSEKQGWENKKVGYETDLDKKSVKKTAGVILIIFSALIKLVALFALSTLNFTFIIIMVVLYMIAIYIHLNHTGYFLAELRTKKEFKKQHDQWADLQMLEAKGGTIPTKHPGKELVVDGSINSTFALNQKLWRHDDVKNNDILKVNEHFIEFEFFKDGKYSYAISTKGILTDDDIKSFINLGNDIDSEIVAMECLIHQTQKIHS